MLVGCNRQLRGALHKEMQLAKVSRQDAARGGFSSTRALGAEDNNLARQHPEVLPRVTGMLLAKHSPLQPRVEIKSFLHNPATTLQMLPYNPSP